MEKSRHPRALLALLVMAVSVASAVLILPAQADSSCPDGRVCLWEHADWEGCRHIKDNSDPTLTDNFPCGFEFNDETSSAKSKKTHSTTLCIDADYLGGVAQTMVAGTALRQVGHNDETSSYKNSLTVCS